MVEAGTGVLVKGRPKQGGGHWWDVYHPDCAPKEEDWSEFDDKASKYQLQLRDYWTYRDEHLVVNAVAGSGKTTTIVWLLATTWEEFRRELGRDPNIVFSCFNVTIRDELATRVPPGTARVATLNSLGHRVVARFLKGNGVEATLNEDSDPKAWRHVRRLFPGSDRQLRMALGGALPHAKDLEGWKAVLARLSGLKVNDELGTEHLKRIRTACDRFLERNARIQKPLKRLVDLHRSTLSDDYAALVSRYSIDDVGKDAKTIFAGVPLVLGSMEDEALDVGVIDYDDQLWLPHHWNLEPQPQDLVAVDEAQDVNAAQFDLLRKMAKRGRLALIGDTAQAIYGFRGAGIGMIQKMQAALDETDRGVSSIPLSVCYRCPLTVLELVRRRGHVTEIEPRPGAELGQIREEDPYEEWWKGCDPNALVLCRTNAPLAVEYFRLVKAGIRATIRGRGEGGIYDQLVSLIDRFAPPTGDLAMLIRNVREYEEMESPKLTAAGDEQKLERLRDLVELVKILSEDMSNVRDLKSRISKAFVHDDKQEPGVVLSTVHKAKGLEAGQVYILVPGLIPWPYAKGWEQEQELNLEYVAYTRAMKELIFVGDAPREAFEDGGCGLVDGPLLEMAERDPALQEIMGDDEEEGEGVDIADLDLSNLPSWPSRGDGTYEPPASLDDWQDVLDAYEAAGVPVKVAHPRGWGSKTALVFAGCVRVSACLRRTRGGYVPVEKGQNAIDVVPVRDGRPSGTTRRVLRRAGWKGRTAQRINEALHDMQRRAKENG